MVEWLSDNWPELVKMAAVFLSLVGGTASVPLINKLKEWLNVDGRWAQIVTLLVSIVVAALSLIVSGVLTPEPLTSQYVITTLTLVMLASQAEYNRIKSLDAKMRAEFIQRRLLD